MAGELKGRWVFVPLESWETKPASYHSLRASRIYLTLAFKVPDDDIRFCLRNNLLPPDKMRGAQMRAWIDGARRAMDRAKWKEALLTVY